MDWDDPLTVIPRIESIKLIETIHGILLQYYHRGSEKYPSKITNEFIQDIERLNNQFVGINDSELELCENEIAELLNNLTSSVINNLSKVTTIPHQICLRVNKIPH